MRSVKRVSRWGVLVLKCEGIDCELKFFCPHPKDFIPADHGLCVDVDASNKSSGPPSMLQTDGD